MKSGHLSMYLCLFRFLFSESYSFQNKDLSPPWLNLNFIILDAIVSGVDFFISFQIGHCF